MIRKISCIICPLSCVGEVVAESSTIIGVSGFSCQRGASYAAEEISAPKRMLTATVRIAGGELPLLPVVSKTVLPKADIVPCARRLTRVVVQAPVEEGQVIVRDIMGRGVDIVASRDMAACRRDLPGGEGGKTVR